MKIKSYLPPLQKRIYLTTLLQFLYGFTSMKTQQDADKKTRKTGQKNPQSNNMILDSEIDNKLSIL